MVLGLEKYLSSFIEPLNVVVGTKVSELSPILNVEPDPIIKSTPAVSREGNTVLAENESKSEPL